jgi:hypothetical protein
VTPPPARPPVLRRPTPRERLARPFNRMLELDARLYCYWKGQVRGLTAVSPDTDIVIEGYMGSANSFAREAFRFANPSCGIASHLHSPSQIERARQLGKPLIFPTRPPVEAIASVAGRWGISNIRHELERYARLYRAFMQAPSEGVVAPFREITEDFGPVIERVNDRYGTSFTPFPSADPQAVAAVEATIEAFNSTVYGTDSAHFRPLPSADRKSAAQTVVDAMNQPRYRSRLGQCDQLYAAVMSTA